MKNHLIQLLPKLRRFAFSLTGDAADADDLVQSTVERLLQKNTYPDRNMTAYIFTVCKNMWIDEIRKRRVRQSDEFVEANHVEPHLEGGLESVEVNELINAVKQLPENSREVLSMVAIAGLSYQEAADQLQVPIGTIMSRIARARSALSEKLARKRNTDVGGDHAIH